MSASPQPATPHAMPGTRATVLVLALALIARLLPFLSLVAHHSTTWIYSRGLETGFVAHSLLIGEGFASPFGGHTGPTALISPGYVLLVTAVFRLFGEASAASAVIILFAQIALGVLTTWLIMRLAAQIAGHFAGARAAIVAGSFFALWPPLLWVPTIFWDTSLTLCLIPALLLLALTLRRRPVLRVWLAFGVLSGLAVLVNLALVPTVAGVFCWAIWTSRSSTRGTRNALLGVLLALFVYAPWPIRNERALHSLIPLRTTVGLELWMGNREGATGYLDESIFPYYNHDELSKYLQRGEVAYMQGKSDAAKVSIRNHPGTFLALTARRVVRFWTGSGNQHGAPLYIVGAALTTLLGLAGFATLYRRGERVACLLLAIPLVLFPLPYYLTHAEFRYRLALDPLLTALAACFVALRAPVVSSIDSVDESLATPAATPEAPSQMAASQASPSPGSAARGYILPITVSALALRVLVAAVVIKTSTPEWLFGQATELSCIAQSVLSGHGYGSPFCGNTGPSAFLAPGYPLFVASVFRLFGVQTMRSAACIMLIQALLSAATVPVAMLIARRHFGSRAAILTGILVALNPWLIGLEAVLWETSFSILSLTAIVGFALLLRQAPTRSRWAAAFLVLGLAVAVNPSLILAGLTLYIAAQWLGPNRKSAQWLLPAVLFFTFCSAWPIRNWKALHAFVPMRTNMGYEIWQGNHPGGNGFFQADLHPNVNRHEYRLYGSLGEIAYMRRKSMLAKTWIKRNPSRFAALTVKRIACFWLGIGRTNSALLIATTALLSLAGVASLLALFRRSWRLATLFAVPLLILPLPYYLAHPDFRFWCLLAPTLTILSAWWLTKGQTASQLGWQLAVATEQVMNSGC